MIDHIFIKNYKAFDRMNLPLDKNTLLIGSNDSGKTSILEALDLFFNGNLNRDYIREKDKDVVVEIHIDDTRYRKVFQSPDYTIDYGKCIGNMMDINHLKFLYVPKKINNAKLLNDILSINLTSELDASYIQKTIKVFDYLDGNSENTTYPLFKYETKYEMAIPNEITFSNEEYTNMIQNITYQHLIIGIDNFEVNFKIKGLKEFTKFTNQTLLTSTNNEVIKEFDYFVQALYKDDVVTEFETIRQQVENKKVKTYLLVEGKYDVAWFEEGLRLLNKQNEYRVIPCGGYGNIEYINKQLRKEGFETIVITDGDTFFENSLKREVIELYADLDYINSRFNTNFEKMPESKIEFFKRIQVKDDIVKKVLSSWARKKLTKDSEFVIELNQILSNK